MMLPMAHRQPETVEPGFRAFVARTLGEQGRSWIAALPEIQATLAARWRLELGRELPGGLLSCVRAARLPDGTRAVLKVAASPQRTRYEVAALRAWGGVGAPALLETDDELGALLLERIAPGTHPVSAQPGAIASLSNVLGIAPPPGLPRLDEAVRLRIQRALDEGRASEVQASWARAKIGELERMPHPICLVHGDLDERNLLECSRRGLCAIDPLPCVGDPAYDAGTWVHGNRRPGRRARLDALVALGFDRARVRDWAAVVAVHG